MEAPRSAVAQLRRGALEYCVLALLQGGELYAVDLVRVMGDLDGLVTSEGTLYPLLSRLRREGLVTTTWHESDLGPPRRYYRITAEGERALSAFVHDWRRFRDTVDSLIDP